MGRRRVLFAAVVLIAGLLLVTRCGQGGEPARPPGAAGQAGVDAVGADPHGVDGATVPDADGVSDDLPGAADAPAPATVDASGRDAGPPEHPSASPTGPAQPAAVAAAERFARAWVDNAPGWAERLTELTTPELARTLADADPATVPATFVTGPGAVLSEVPGWARVEVPTDAGSVVLHVVASDEDWLVSAIEWRPRW